MRVFATTAVLLCTTLTCFAQEVVPLNTQTAKKVADPASYGIGYGIGSDMKQQGLSAEFITQADLITGIMDALAGKEMGVAGPEIQAAMKFVTTQQQVIADSDTTRAGESVHTPTDADTEAAFVDLCHALLNANEFLFVE